MSQPPDCRAMGRHCTELNVTLKIGDLDDDGEAAVDALATWLLGHTQRITFGRVSRSGTTLRVTATLHVPCRYLREGQKGARCAAHGFRARAVPRTRPQQRDRKLGDETFEIVQDRRVSPVRLRRPPRSLPVLAAGANPCVGAPCRTADHVRGAACCRDLVVALHIPARDRWREALVRSRKSPYLCKVDRTGPTTLEAEMISACSFLERDGISCALHGRRRPNGRVAKPWLCTEWPRGAETTHPGCRLAERTAPPLDSRASPSCASPALPNVSSV